ncbi:MAG: hypothetical protein AAB420_03940 [Patescibacteria group bacterium]
MSFLALAGLAPTIQSFLYLRKQLLGDNRFVGSFIDFPIPIHYANIYFVGEQILNSIEGFSFLPRKLGEAVRDRFKTMFASGKLLVDFLDDLRLAWFWDNIS